MNIGNQHSMEVNPNSEPRGCAYQLLWHAASFILPAFSLRYYRIAQRKRLSQALTFFLLFASVLTVLFTFKFVRVIREMDAQIKEAAQNGDFPVIKIENGIAAVAAPQPLVLLDQAGQLFVLDTTGTYTSIDPQRYREGILLTRTELQVLGGSGESNTLRLSELNDLFNTNPIVIDEGFVLQAWDGFSRAAVVIAAVVLWVWHFFVRLMVILLVGLLIRASNSVLRNQVDFVSIFIIGLYAAVPTLYLHYLLSRAGLNLPGLQTMILMMAWLGISIANLGRGAQPGEHQEEVLLRMTPIGIPMLLVLAWDVVFTPVIQAVALWVVPVLTFIIWMVMRRVQMDGDELSGGAG